MMELPFPPSILSGHNTGHYRVKGPVVKKWRADAFHAAKAAKLRVAAAGDIMIKVTFIPPDNRGDRVNFGNRMKPIFDGIADALKVNDRRFVPEYIYCEPAKPGCVRIEVES